MCASYLHPGGSARAEWPIGHDVVVSSLPRKLNGFGSCGCDHWRDARTVWIIGWAVLTLMFALIVLVRRARLRRRVHHGGCVVEIDARRRRVDDLAGPWERGTVRFDPAAGPSMRWTPQGAGSQSDVDLASLRRGAALGASQFPFTVSLTAHIDDEAVTLAMRPGDDMALLELARSLGAIAHG
jgi:hypothetical protein